MEKSIHYPEKYSLLDESEMEYLDGGWWYKGHNWRDRPLYATSTSRSQYASWNHTVTSWIGGISLVSGFGGPVGQIIGAGLGIAAATGKNPLNNGRWNRAVQYCFQDGKHSNLYFTAYMHNNTMIGHDTPWIYTN